MRPSFGLRAFLSAVLLVILAIGSPALAQGVQADLQATLIGTYSGSNSLGSVAFQFNQQVRQQFSPGVAVGKADKLYAGARSLAASGSEGLDLAGGLSDPFGQTLTFARVKAIYIKAASANANGLVVGGAASNAFLGPFAAATDKLTIAPGGSLLLIHPGAGWSVTAGTGDILSIANGGTGTSVAYDIVLIGASS